MRPARPGLCLSIAVLLATGFSMGAAAVSLESAVKAAYLVKFGGFVTWPGTAFAAPSSPFVICVEPPDPFGASLDEAAAGQSVAQHPIEVRRLPPSSGGAGCHVLFVGRPADSAPVHGPVLTVTDVPSGAPRKGIINFVIVDNHVRFEIEDGAAAANGLRMSSQLLALAVGDRLRP